MTMISNKIIANWAKDPTILKLGYRGPGVDIFELLCKDFSPDLYRGKIDDWFAKGCDQAALKFQQYRMLVEDGEVGPKTKAEMVRAYHEAWNPGIPYPMLGSSIMVYGPWHKDLGYFPDVELGKVEGGKMSSFGGPRDSGDRIYSQAYIDGAGSPQELIDKHPELVDMSIIMNAEQALAAEYGRRDWKPEGTPFFNGDLSKWPETKGCGQVTKAGTSSMMNPESYFIAMRWTKTGGRAYRNEYNPKVLVWVPETGKGCVTMRSDWGPRKTTGRNADLSDGTCDALYLERDDNRRLPTDSYIRYTWVPKNTPLGPVEVPCA